MRRMDIIFDIDIDQNPSCQSKLVGKNKLYLWLDLWINFSGSTILFSYLFYLCPIFIFIFSTKHFNFASEVCQLISESFTLLDIQLFQIRNFA